MPKTHPRYTKAISVAVTQELYDHLRKEAEQQGLRLSAVIRNALEGLYNIKTPSIYTILVSDAEATKLRNQGFRIAEQE